MSKQRYNIEHKNKHEVGESNYSIVDLTRVNGKVAVILQYPSSSVAQAMHTIKVYYPKHVEKSFHDYDETGKYMYAAKVDYYINKLMFLETGSLMKDATVWFDNKSMPLDTFKAKCLGQILLTGTQVDKLNTCNMSVTSYTVTFK